MKSVLRTTICMAAMSLAVPALAQSTGGTSMSHHHYAKHMHHGMMSKGMHGMHGKGDMAVEKLNEQSLMSAKGSTGGAMAPASSGTMAPPASSGMMAPPPATGSMKSGSGLSGDAAPTNGGMQGAGNPVAGSSGMGAGTPASTGSSGGTMNQTH